MTAACRICLTLAVAALSASLALADTDLSLPPLDLDNPAEIPPGVNFGDPTLGGDDAPTLPDDADKADDADAPLPGVDDGDVSSGWQQKFFAINWRRVASSYALVDGKYLVATGYDPRMPSSLGQSTDQWLRDRTKTTRVSVGGGLVRTQKIGPARDEALAVTTRLPDLRPGSYGHIDSAKIVRVVGPDEMLITDLRLVDPDRLEKQKEADRNTALRNSASIIDDKVRQEEIRLKESLRRDRNNDDDRNSRSRTRTNDDIDNQLARYRDKAIADQKKIVDKALDDRFAERDKLVKEQQKLASATVRIIGFKTGGQREGARWTGGGTLGPQIAIVDVPADKTDRDARGRNKTVTALSTDLLRTGLTEEQFRTLLEQRGLTVESFAELARPVMKDNPGFANAKIVEAIEKFGALSAAADPKSSDADPKPDDKPRPSRSSKPADTDFFDNK